MKTIYANRTTGEFYEHSAITGLLERVQPECDRIVKIDFGDMFAIVNRIVGKMRLHVTVDHPVNRLEDISGIMHACMDTISNSDAKLATIGISSGGWKPDPTTSRDLLRTILANRKPWMNVGECGYFIRTIHPYNSDAIVTAISNKARNEARCRAATNMADVAAFKKLVNVVGRRAALSSYTSVAGTFSNPAAYSTEKLKKLLNKFEALADKYAVALSLRLKQARSKPMTLGTLLERMDRTNIGRGYTHTSPLRVLQVVSERIGGGQGRAIAKIETVRLLALWRINAILRALGKDQMPNLATHTVMYAISQHGSNSKAAWIATAMVVGNLRLVDRLPYRMARSVLSEVHPDYHEICTTNGFIARYRRTSGGVDFTRVENGRVLWGDHCNDVWDDALHHISAEHVAMLKRNAFFFDDDIESSKSLVKRLVARHALKEKRAEAAKRIAGNVDDYWIGYYD